MLCRARMADLRLPASGKRFRILGSSQMQLLILLLLPLALSTAWGQVSAPLPEESTRAGIEAVLADFDHKKPDDALAKLEVMEKKLPDDPLVLNLIGSAYTKKKDYLAAETYFRKAVKKSPDFFPALFNIGEVFFLQKKYAEAREHFQAMRGSDTRNELLQFKLVLCDLALNETDRAKKVMNAIKYPGNSAAWYYAHAAYENKMGNNKKAREYVAGAQYIFGPKTSLFDESFEAAGISLR
jgi:tetratricopeptide (TPR) repeat protein